MTNAMIPMGMAMITNATKALTRSMIPLSKSAQETSGVERRVDDGLYSYLDFKTGFRRVCWPTDARLLAAVACLTPASVSAC